jgi:hypothetical protein
LKGRICSSHSLPSTNANSTSAATGLPSSPSCRNLAAISSAKATSCFTSPGPSSVSAPEAGSFAMPPFAWGTMRRGAVAVAMRRTFPVFRSIRTDSAAWPSTAPPTPSLTATDSTSRSPESTSCVIITPEMPEGTVRRSRTAGYTCSGPFMCDCRHAQARRVYGEAQTSEIHFTMLSKPTTLNSVRLRPAPVKPGRSSTFVSERTKTPPSKFGPNSRAIAARNRCRKSGPGSVPRTIE